MGKTMARFSRLFLIRSFSYLQVMITYTRAWMSLKFSQIKPQVFMVKDRVIMEKNSVLSILAGNNDMHERLEEFKFGLIRPLELAALERLKKCLLT